MPLSSSFSSASSVFMYSSFIPATLPGRVGHWLSNPKKVSGKISPERTKRYFPRQKTPLAVKFKYPHCKLSMRVFVYLFGKHCGSYLPIKNRWTQVKPTNNVEVTQPSWLPKKAGWSLVLNSYATLSKVPCQSGHGTYRASCGRQRGSQHPPLRGLCTTLDGPAGSVATRPSAMRVLWRYRVFSRSGHTEHNLCLLRLPDQICPYVLRSMLQAAPGFASAEQARH
jgi:hypothetical protein